MGIVPGATVLVVDRQHWAGDQVVEAAEIVAAADRYRLRYRIPVAGRAGGDSEAGQPAIPGAP